MGSRTLTIVAAVALSAVACGGPTGEAELKEASAKLEDVRAQVEDAKEKVAARQAGLEKAKQALAEAQTELREAERRLAKTEAQVDLSATDAVLFRSIQKQLLEDDKLENVAISAKVTSGNVVLSGSVPNAKLRDRALALARATPGVVSVQSLIEVPVSAKKAD